MGKVLFLVPVMLSTAGCVQVSAPDKPIEINLNINIRQEVVVRLQQDVRDLIDKNPGVF
ncbi:YnbE family lipoprotein [Sphingosinicella sp. BN140058]|uniref:YnbE family lipoprotein n=1 Tax=Sphingosinicella sp. BN140058 TaxID=1892855 RepID=UPI00101130CA|nr:YnbE family lipoprotein [Sphingosinicella sp. BN140058]QAY75480.1 YnbE family lipoprotein [Sphingosinicella sp. BN140058]